MLILFGDLPAAWDWLQQGSSSRNKLIPTSHPLTNGHSKLQKGAGFEHFILNLASFGTTHKSTVLVFSTRLHPVYFMAWVDKNLGPVEDLMPFNWNPLEQCGSDVPFSILIHCEGCLSSILCTLYIQFLGYWEQNQHTQTQKWTHNQVAGNQFQFSRINGWN